MVKKSNTQPTPKKKIQKKNSDTKAGIIGLVVLSCIGLAWCGSSNDYTCGKDVICPSRDDQLAGRLYRTIDTNKPVTGTVHEHYSNGKLNYEGGTHLGIYQVKNGKRDRESFFFYPMGSLGGVLEIFYKDGKEIWNKYISPEEWAK